MRHSNRLLQLKDTADEPGWVAVQGSLSAAANFRGESDTNYEPCYSSSTPPAKTNNTHSYGRCHQAGQFNKRRGIIVQHETQMVM